MLDAEQWWQYQQTMLHWWMDACAVQSQEWLRWLPGRLMGKQVHGLSEEQRGAVKEIAERHSEILQQMLTLNLQNFSLNSEVSESCMEFMNRLMGIKT